tara:strand:+ start:469 stop:882 length:414 start_codon:yes stop_codon:yes gene_type:complete
MKKIIHDLEQIDDKVELTPMLDCVFLLLLFFIVTASYSDEKLFDVILPTIKGGESQLIDPFHVIQLNITEDGSFQVKDKQIETNNLYAYFESIKKERPTTTLIINGHKNCPYEKVVFAMDVAKGANIEEYSFVVQSE